SSPSLLPLIHLSLPLLSVGSFDSIPTKTPEFVTQFSRRVFSFFNTLFHVSFTMNGLTVFESYLGLVSLLSSCSLSFMRCSHLGLRKLQRQKTDSYLLSDPDGPLGFL
ncbi:hypothetical protein WG66_008265, partial [Moniliophthora roreri]